MTAKAIDAGTIAVRKLIGPYLGTPEQIAKHGDRIKKRQEESALKHATACIEAAIASGELVPASAGPFVEEIATLARRFWSIHPSKIAAKNLTREEFYAREMTKLVQMATANAVAAERERCAVLIDSKKMHATDVFGDAWNGAIEAASRSVRALSPGPASDEFVVVPRGSSYDIWAVECGGAFVSLWLSEENARKVLASYQRSKPSGSWNVVRLVAAMLDAATKDGERS